MATLTIDSENALAAYHEAPQSFRKSLIKLFGAKNLFASSLERVNSYEDACEVVDIDPIESLPFVTPVNKRQVATNARFMVDVIQEAIVGDWVADYNNPNQRKWYPRFIYDSASTSFRFSYAFYGSAYAYASSGARLSFETEEQAIYVGTKFIDLFNKFLIK